MTSTDLKTSDISIIIPALNEEQSLAGLSENLQGKAGEVILVDGGSSDGTLDRAREFGLRVEQGPAGRALQLNHGASRATGRILLFLHADTRLPDDFAGHVLEAVAQRDIIAAAFSLAIEKAGPGLRFISFWANIRSRLLQLPYGDQAIFLLKDNFDRIGGFPELPIMEDFCFVRKAKKLGRIHILKAKVTTSARRWERLGIARTTIINQLVVLGFLLRISPHRLRSLYRK